MHRHNVALGHIGRRTLAWMVAGAAAAGAAAIFAWSGGDKPAPFAPGPIRTDGVATAPAVPVAGAPLDWVKDPAGAGGAVPLSRLPDDAYAPAGAVRLYAFRVGGPDGQRDSITFLADGDVAAAAAFYRTRLAQAGYSLLKTGPGMRGPGQTLLVFLNPTQDSYTVSLVPADNGRKVRVVLVISRLKRT